MDDETFFNMMRQNNPAMFEYVSETVNKGIREGNAPRPPKEENFMSMKKGEQDGLRCSTSYGSCSRLYQNIEEEKVVVKQSIRRLIT